MGGTEEKGETVAQMVDYDLDGSGVGVEYFFESTLFKSAEAKEDGENPGHERDDEDGGCVQDPFRLHLHRP